MGTANFGLGYVVPGSAAKEIQVNSTLDQIDALFETLLTGETAALAGDTDVALSSEGSPPVAIADGDVLTYDATAGKWENKPATAGSSTLGSDTDVSLSGLSQSDVLHYDTTLSEWVNAPIGWYSASAGFVYQDNATDLAGWTSAISTGVVSSAVEQSSGVTSILEAVGHSNQFNVGSSLANRVISFYVNMPLGNSVGCFLFGCDSSGNGVGLSLSSGYTDSEFMTTSSWTPGPPGSGSILASGWRLIVITIDAAGTHASWSADGVAQQTNVAITLAGNYIGLYSNGTYGGDFYFSQIQVALPSGENWTSSRTVSGGVSTVALTYSGTNTPVFRVSGGVGTTINSQTASYTAVLGDANNLVTLNNASANTFTVPTHASVAFAIGTTLSVTQTGAGQITLTPASGVTLNTPSSLTARAQWSTVSMIQTATDVWVCGGDLT